MAKGTIHTHQASRKNGKNLPTTHITVVTASKADIPGTGTEEPQGILILGQACLCGHSLSIGLAGSLHPSPQSRGLGNGGSISEVVPASFVSVFLGPLFQYFLTL